LELLVLFQKMTWKEEELALKNWRKLEPIYGQPELTQKPKVALDVRLVWWVFESVGKLRGSVQAIAED
jgi:hypothetical protein